MNTSKIKGRKPQVDVYFVATRTLLWCVEQKGLCAALARNGEHLCTSPNGDTYEVVSETHVKAFHCSSDIDGLKADGWRFLSNKGDAKYYRWEVTEFSRETANNVVAALRQYYCSTST